MTLRTITLVRVFLAVVFLGMGIAILIGLPGPRGIDPRHVALASLFAVGALFIAPLERRIDRTAGTE